MKKPFNPLFDTYAAKNTDKKSLVQAMKNTVLSSDFETSRFKPAFCGDIPVLVDLDSRTVLPVKE